VERREARGETRRRRLPDKENSNWAWDEQAGQFFLHRFYSHQPDLNVANPAVRDEIAQIMGFWIEQGLSGFRIDAVPFLLEPIGMPEGALVDPHELLRDLRAFITRRNGEAMLLGEVNLEPPDARKFFGDEDGDELHMLFDFVGMQAMYLALARGDAAPLRTALRDTPEIPSDCQWGRFVRNHDELTLDKLSDAEREEVFAAFGPDESLQLFGRGLRRRLPPMLDGDQQAIRMVYSLAFSLPGTPVLFYGEEIGWARISRSRVASACARRCSGPTSRTADSPPWPTRKRSAGRLSPMSASGPPR
jgi:maltose alpha-D-glucosyltransferase/alpha-amylase